MESASLRSPRNINPSLASLAFTSLTAPNLRSFAANALPRRILIETVTTGLRYNFLPELERLLQKAARNSKACTVGAQAQPLVTSMRTSAPKKF